MPTVRAPRRRGAVPLSALAATAALLAPLAAAEFERAGAVPAARYLAPAQLSGPEWRVAEQADNDGAFNTYSVESRFGAFPARGSARVAVRGQEVAALVELERVSKTDVFKEAVKRSAMGSVETVKAFATKPRETISGIPEGVGRWYKKTKFKVQETYVDVQEERQEHAEADAEQKSEQRDELQGEAKDLAHKEALDYLKISGAERRWYAELGVDPFTDNQVLREVVREYSRVEGLTSFGMKFAGLPGIPGAREVRKAMALVWQTDPWELRLQNRKKLLAAGITEATARRFEDNPNLTLTQQTGLLLSLDELKGVAGRQSVLARAIEVDSKAGGQMLTHSLGLMASIHREQKLAAILEGTALPVARLAAGGLVAVLPADAVFWTEPIAAAAAEFAAAYRPEGAPARELRVLGQVTERATRELGELGWRVVERWRPAERDEPSPAG